MAKAQTLLMGAVRARRGSASLLRSPRWRILLTPLIVLAYWQILSSSGLISPYLLPPPLTVCKTFIELGEAGELLRHVSASLLRVVQGFTLSCVLGITLAWLVNRLLILEELLAAPLALLRMIPPLAMIPLLILWLGIGDATRLTIIVLASFFPIYLNTRDGLRRVTAEQHELVRSLHLSAWRKETRVVLPAALPSMITGARLAFGYSWRALIGAELIAASSGLGYLIVNAQGMQRTDVVIAGILIIGMIGWLLDTLFCRVIAMSFQRRFPEVVS